jgi:hypothetical protein
MCAHAVMSAVSVPDWTGIPDIHVGLNHYHLVLYVESEKAHRWTKQDEWWCPITGISPITVIKQASA